jgi:hypothetical protein
MSKERVMTTATSLRSHIKSLEEQLRVLSALAHSFTTLASERPYALADLEGLLRGQTDTTETDIDAVLYRVPLAMDEAL